MNRDELEVRLEALSASSDFTLPPDIDLQQVDLRNDEDVDRLAGELLHHFRERDDPEAFTLLFEICQTQIVDIAKRITRQLAMAFDPEDLVASFMSRLFIDVRKDQPKVKRFLGLAFTAMRNDALNQLRKLRRAHERHLVYDEMHRDAQDPPDPAATVDHAEQTQKLTRLGTVLLHVVNVCFHRLPERDRRILLLREVDGLTYDQIAEAMTEPRNQVGMILKRARQHLSDAIADFFRGTP